MPTYEFRCQNGHTFQRFYKSITGSDMELPCPDCGAVAARLLSGGAGLVFKGSGFYLTDYGKNAHRGSAAGAGAGEKAGEGKSEGGKVEPAKSDAGAAPPAAKPEGAKPKAETSKPAASSSKPKAE